MLIVATDQDEVHAIDAESGAQIWERTLGEPAPRSALPCGNLPTLGVTGAPVIDPARATLYLDAMVMRANEPRHEIYALALADGSVESGWPVDVAAALKGSFIPSVQNERGALALFAGRIFVPYSGHYGDCGDYHGFVVGVSETDPAKVESFATRARGGGIWGQGGVAGDGKSLFVATGNTFGARAWGDGEAVLRLGPGLARLGRLARLFRPRELELPRCNRSGPRLNRPDSARCSERQRRSKAHLRHRQVRRRLPSRPRQSWRDRPPAFDRACHGERDHRVSRGLARGRRNGRRAAGLWRELSARQGGKGTCRAQDQRRSCACDRNRLVRGGSRQPRVADRHHHGRDRESDRVHRRRRGRQPALRLSRRHGRTHRFAAGTYARLPPI